MGLSFLYVLTVGAPSPLTCKHTTINSAVPYGAWDEVGYAYRTYPTSSGVGYVLSIKRIAVVPEVPYDPFRSRHRLVFRVALVRRARNSWAAVIAAASADNRGDTIARRHEQRAERPAIGRHGLLSAGCGHGDSARRWGPPGHSWKHGRARRPGGHPHGRWLGGCCVSMPLGRSTWCDPLAGFRCRLQTRGPTCGWPQRVVGIAWSPLPHRSPAQVSIITAAVNHEVLALYSIVGLPPRRL